jgi:hypothetical protein
MNTHSLFVVLVDRGGRGMTKTAPGVLAQQVVWFIRMQPGCSWVGGLKLIGGFTDGEMITSFSI